MPNQWRPISEVMDRDELNAKPCTPPEVADEREHFYLCHCGQAVDMRRLGDVLHHEQADHDPLPTDS
jgi:hypothetical protein